MANTALSSPAAEAWALVQRLVGPQRKRFMALAAEYDLSPPQLGALKALDPARPVAMSELAGILGCDNSTVTGIVDRLEYRGLVERRPADHDRRVKLLALTEEGQELREALGERLHAPPHELASLSLEDQRALRDILRRAFE
ncbi:MAG: MarR family transcriptional regulator [Actinobacteria bacterium]|nr:MAG: MarR family transcriptional regulator [Actinomycetota bacterium]